MRGLHVRLSLLMFLVYSVTGAWWPVLTLHLDQLGFSPLESALVCATSALGAILGPLWWGQIADRWLASEKCICLCSAAGGLLLGWAALSSQPGPMFCACLAHWFFFVPVFSLCTSLTFRHLTEPEGAFGPIRMWGTVGWVVASWALGGWLSNPALLAPARQWLRPGAPDAALRDCLWLAMGLSWALGLYAWTLPATPPNPQRGGRPWWRAMVDAPLHASGLFRRREVACLALCLFGVVATMPFSGQMAPLLLQKLGVSTAWVPVTLTLAQSTELAALALLPRLLHRLGEKRTLTAGILAWSLALSALAWGEPGWLVIASLGLHGFFIVGFLVTGQLAVNRRASGHFRASAQGLLQWISGLGLLLGHGATGFFRHFTGQNFGVGFGAAALLAGLLTMVLMAGFHPHSKEIGATPKS